MPLPLIIGAAVLAAASYGAKKGYDGYQKHSEADKIVKTPNQNTNAKNIFLTARKATHKAPGKNLNIKLQINLSEASKYFQQFIHSYPCTGHDKNQKT